MNVRTRDRRLIVWRKSSLRQGGSNLRQWQKLGGMHAENFLNSKISCTQRMRRQKRRGVPTANKQQKYFLRRKRRCMRCNDLPQKMAENMEEVEEKAAEVRRVTHHNMDYMEKRRYQIRPVI